MLLVAVIFMAAGMTGKLLGVFSAVLAHELAHALVAEALGYRVREIELLPFGGVAKIEGLNEAKAKNELLIAAAGPLTSTVLAVVAYWLKTLLPSAAAALQFWLEVNVMLAVFNLLPGVPLDGGRIIRAWLSMFWGYSQATRFTVQLSRLISLLLMGIVVYNYVTVKTINLTFAFAGIFLYLASQRELAMARFRNFRVLARKKADLMAKGFMPASHFIALTSTMVQDIIRAISAESYAVVLVVDENFRPRGTITETELWEGIPERGLKARIGDFLPSRWFEGFCRTVAKE